ncbi:MAG: tmRNA-binding protein SmpB, partial [uncultured Pseudonocardia sp.]
EGEGQQGHRAEPQGATRLHGPRHVRDRCGPARHRGEEPAAGPGVAGGRVRDRRRRRGVAARTPHPGVLPRQLDQPRAAPHAQAPAAPRGDRPPDRQDQGGRAVAGAAVAVLPRRQGQVRAGAGEGQEGLRQAHRPGQARRAARDRPRLRAGREGSGPGDAV